ncbi:YdcF family protein [Candidatus Parcubacteria bacterium]|nr:YdcF family protein [Candidatus Parcubacteria bacterium]
MIVYGCGPQDSDRLTSVGKLVTEAAARVFCQFPQEMIIISTGGKTGKSLLSEAEVMKKELIKLGVPKKCVIMEPNATNTIENIAFVANIVDELGLDDLIHITNRVHMSQVKELCMLIGLEKISSYEIADEIIKHEIEDSRSTNTDRWMRGLREVPLYWLPQIANIIENPERWKCILRQPRLKDFLKEQHRIAKPEEIKKKIKKEKRIMP